MKKEITFRAKRKDNGEWVYGAYFKMHHNDERNHIHHFIIPDGTDISLGTPIEKIQVEIDPDTLGMFTCDGNIEPEEMLMVERKKVVEWYSSLSNEHKIYAKGTTDRISLGARLAMIEELFGDKCLPDKESVQVEPKYKFSLGHKVILHFHGEEKGTISERLPPQEGNVWNCYKVKELPYHLWRENELEPYTEPETKDAYEQYQEAEYEKYKNQLKDMEEKELGKEDNFTPKELNLCDFLKDCIGEEFWSPMFDVVKLSRIDIDDNKPLFFNWKDGVIYTRANGVMYNNTLPIIFPSRTLYEKYPLDTYSAWMEWKEMRKIKRWVPDNRETYWYFDSCLDVFPSTFSNMDVEDTIRLGVGNCFTTQESCAQAAEAVRECLEKFYKDHTPKDKNE